MSDVFFKEMDAPEPNVNLGVGSGTQGWQTGQMLMRIEEVLLAQQPDWVLVYGDTNSTLAGALATCKLSVSLAHVEAGVRSFNRKMPEEHNRVLTDHCSEVLFCPTKTAVNNLSREGITEGVHLVGDTMYDAVLQYRKIGRQRSKIMADLNLKPKKYVLATVHRSYNTIRDNLSNILQAFRQTGEPVVFPVHPRTRKTMAELGVDVEHYAPNVRMIDPVGYLDMLVLEENARLILTDSGGVQKEAYFLEVPCVTLRPETEWVETVESGWNVIGGSSPQGILHAIQRVETTTHRSRNLWFGDGNASGKILNILESS